ncbi:MAG TPA: hypothetical protein VJ485_01565 [archaeon]|nr:hypothetical protein [archaeon]
MYFILSLVFAIGVLTKLADLIADDGLKVRKTLSYAVGMFYGFLAAYVLAAEPLLASIILAAVIAVLLMEKIDKQPHIVGIAAMLFMLGIWGFPPINVVLLALFTATGIIDEVGNDFSDKGRIKGRFRRVMEYRPTSNIFGFLVSALTGWWIIFLGMIVFDAGYIAVGEAGKRLHGTRHTSAGIPKRRA